jgi:hypothetical protein
MPEKASVKVSQTTRKSQSLKDLATESGGQQSTEVGFCNGRQIDGRSQLLVLPLSDSNVGPPLRVGPNNENNHLDSEGLWFDSEIKGLMRPRRYSTFPRGSSTSVRMFMSTFIRIIKGFNFVMESRECKFIENHIRDTCLLFSPSLIGPREISCDSDGLISLPSAVNARDRG